MQEYPFETDSPEVPELVSQVPFFSALEKTTVDVLLHHTTILEAEPGDTVVHQGEDDRCLVFLVRGTADIVKDGEPIAWAGETGELLGELSVLRGEPHSASVVATSSVFCLKTRPTFIDTLSRHERASYEAAFYKYIANLLARRLVASSEKLADAEGRLSATGGD